jgi:hypothetical protein
MRRTETAATTLFLDSAEIETAVRMHQNSGV